MQLREDIARSYSFAPCITGWNARDPLDNMEETDAIRLVNWFPDGTQLSLRRGTAVQATGMGTGSVRTLAEYVGSTGTRKLLAGANGCIYDATTSGAAATVLASGLGVNSWQTVMFRGYSIWVNGNDTPQKYDGTVAAAAVYTGVADPKTLVNVSSYKSRLYFVQANSGSIWYGSVNAIIGALTEFDASSLLRLGGYVVFAGSWTRDTGKGLQDLFVIISNMGEILLYEGDSPADTAWSIVGRFMIGPILGSYRGAINMGPDLIVLSQDGFYPLADLLSQNSGRTFSNLTDKIRNAVSDAARSYNGNFGWSACYYPRGRYTLFNIPVASDTQYEQYVVNTVTGAWTRFTGMNGSCWCTMNGNLYFGGTNGKAYLADTGANDNGAAIQSEIKCAFNYFKDRENAKRFLTARPIFFGDTQTAFLLDTDVDLNDSVITSTVTTTGNPGAAWETATWDVDSWDSNSGSYDSPLYNVTGIGRCAALKIIGNFYDVSLNLTSVQMTYEIGRL